MQQQKIKVPTWVEAEITVDISDIWVEEVDPENEHGTFVEAHLSTNPSGFIALDGISITEGSTTIHAGREWAEKMIGHEAIDRIEAIEQEAA